MSHVQDLKTHIRIALHSLGRDPQEKLPRGTFALRVMLGKLREEQRAKGGILRTDKEPTE